MAETEFSQPAVRRPRQQDTAIQSLRGLAIILLVALHVIGSPTHGLRVSDDSLWHFSTVALSDIRMPLFTLISGYVYAMAPISNWKSYPRLMKGKSRRLLLPLVVVGTLFYAIGRVVPGSNFDGGNIPLWRVYLFSFEHLWFLQAIFIIFVVVGVLDSMGAMATRSRWFVTIAAAAAVSVFVVIPPEFDVFTLSGALRLLPFFLLGYGLRRHALFDLRGTAAVVAVGFFALVYSVRLLTIFGVYHPGRQLNAVVAIAVGASGIILLYSARNVINSRLLAWIGGFSFGIYLLHVFATAANRMALGHIGIHQTWVLFIVGLFMGIAAPIAVQLAFRNVNVVRTLVFGERGFDGRATYRGLIGKLSGRPLATPSGDLARPVPPTPEESGSGQAEQTQYGNSGRRVIRHA